MSQLGRILFGTPALEKKGEDTLILLDVKRVFSGDVSHVVDISRGIMGLVLFS